MPLSIALFGITRDIIGRATLQLPGPAPATVADLMQQLRSQYPELTKLTSCVVAVNNEYAADEQRLRETDEIALIPPVAGG